MSRPQPSGRGVTRRLPPTVSNTRAAPSVRAPIMSTNLAMALQLFDVHGTLNTASDVWHPTFSEADTEPLNFQVATMQPDANPLNMDTASERIGQRMVDLKHEAYHSEVTPLNDMKPRSERINRPLEDLEGSRNWSDAVPYPQAHRTSAAVALPFSEPEDKSNTNDDPNVSTESRTDSGLTWIQSFSGRIEARSGCGQAFTTPSNSGNVATSMSDFSYIHESETPSSSPCSSESDEEEHRNVVEPLLHPRRNSKLKSSRALTPAEIEAVVNQQSRYKKEECFERKKRMLKQLEKNGDFRAPKNQSLNSVARQRSRADTARFRKQLHRELLEENLKIALRGCAKCQCTCLAKQNEDGNEKGSRS